ncbi:hypothetical protein [Burkholderia sp. LMG 13014]|uniref:hypothetical protein n=1 Tax=Burkholderia sp. LMG 13014 TaxID=2709306 RepID=UPI001963A415|nr:hypothetical protein [Burkholderia sp. LMG 13014]
MEQLQTATREKACLSDSFDDQASQAEQIDSQSPAHIGEPNGNLSPLPGKIANALVRVYEGLHEFNLVENQRKVFACLIRFGVNLNHPEANIFIKKSTIASKLNINEATVYRSLTALQASGLIERDAQKREGRNIKTIGYIRLTRLALNMLGLSRGSTTPAVRPNGESHATQPSQGLQEAVAAAGKGVINLAPVQDVNNAPKQSYSKNQPRRGLFEKIGNRTVPGDLAWLHTDNALSLSGLFKLMRIAKQKGARLSDVVMYSRHALSSLKGRELYAYLTTLIGLPVDHAWRAKEQSEQLEAAAAQAAEKRRDEEQIEEIDRLAGQSFVAPGGQLWTVEEGSFYVQSQDQPAGSVPFRFAGDAITQIVAGTWPRHDGVVLAAPVVARRVQRTVAGGGPLQALKEALRLQGRGVLA